MKCLGNRSYLIKNEFGYVIRRNRRQLQGTSELVEYTVMPHDVLLSDNNVLKSDRQCSKNATEVKTGKQSNMTQQQSDDLGDSMNAGLRRSNRVPKPPSRLNASN